LMTNYRRGGMPVRRAPHVPRGSPAAGVAGMREGSRVKKAEIQSRRMIGIGIPISQSNRPLPIDVLQCPCLMFCSKLAEQNQDQ
jgi:hypothetical protein